MEPSLLEMRGIARHFPNGTVALHNASLEIKLGEVHGLIGANGAGKSTLIAILSAALAPSDGELRWRGASVKWRRPVDARRAGVATLYQHIPLIPTLSALENIVLDQAGGWRRSGVQRERARSIVASLGDPFELDAPVGRLPIGARQMVAIAQALAAGADLIVMDEPTASLAVPDREAVYRSIRGLVRERAKSVLFVSHFLDEILALTDRVTVLRDGRDVMTRNTADLSEALLAESISGRQVERLSRRGDRPRTGSCVIEVKGLRSPGLLEEVNLTIRAGEIVGVAGVLGSGRSELLRAIFGADSNSQGEVVVDGRSTSRGIDGAIAAGLAHVPEDRRRQGYVAGLSIADNLALPVRKCGLFVNRPRENEQARSVMGTLSIKAQGPNAAVGSLSGGNAQKVVFAKWLSPATRVLLLDEPTAGVDIGARTDILELIRHLADRGLAVLMVSSDYSELIALCNRIVVMRDGAMIADVDPLRTNESELILMAGGSTAATAGATG